MHVKDFKRNEKRREQNDRNKKISLQERMRICTLR